jgi:outer membrane protein W
MSIKHNAGILATALALLLCAMRADAQQSMLGLQAGYAFVMPKANGNVAAYEDYSNLPLGFAADFRIHKSFYFSPEISFSKRSINTVFEDFFIGEIPSTLKQNQTEVGIVLRYYFLQDKRLQPFAAGGFGLGFANPKEISLSNSRYDAVYELKRSADINGILELGLRTEVLKRLYLSLGARYMPGANTADLSFTDSIFGTGGYQATLQLRQVRAVLRATYALGK